MKTRRSAHHRLLRRLHSRGFERLLKHNIKALKEIYLQKLKQGPFLEYSGSRACVIRPAKKVPTGYLVVVVEPAVGGHHKFGDMAVWSTEFAALEAVKIGESRKEFDETKIGSVLKLAA